MKIASSLYYLLDRRLGNPKRFERLYTLDPDPFGCEVFPYEKEKADTVIEVLAEKHFSHVLDIGCGTGVLTKMLSGYAEKITAIDFSPKAIEIARAKIPDSGQVTFFCDDIRNFPLTDVYDLVVCSEVLYYLTKDELASFLTNLCKSQQRGTFLISVGKLHDLKVQNILLKRLRQINRIKKANNRRPYAIDLYQIR